MTGTIRFSAVTKAAGQPQVYLPFVDPRTDAGFMKLVKAHRVLSLKQPPTGTQKDYGIVGALFEKHVTYLLFAKSLKAFEGKRVVGIKYDAMEKAGTLTGIAPRKAPPRIMVLPKPKVPAPPKAKPAPKPPPPEPAEKPFAVTIRATAVKEVHLTVEALSKQEARKKALAEAPEKVSFDDAEIVFSLKKITEGVR